MSKIDYQALRELAKQATQGEWVAFISTGTGTYAVHTPGDKRCEDVIKWTGFDGQKNAENNARYIAAFNPEVVQALLDENESMCRDLIARNGEIEGLRKLVAELEETKSKLNEQREYYEGVISDGSKRIAELEKSEEQLINERDHAESALADMYFAATGDRPEWSNCFSFSDAVDAVVDRIADLEAKQPSPVVPDNASESLAYAYKELTPEIMRGHIAVFERYGIAPNDSSTTIQALRIALTSLEAEPIAWRYRYVKKGVTDFQGKQWAGDWKYVPTKEDCNDRPNYEIQALFTAPPAPVTSEGLVKAVRFYEQVKRENPPVETGAWKDAVDWVLKEACKAVNIGIKGE